MLFRDQRIALFQRRRRLERAVASMAAGIAVDRVATGDGRRRAWDCTLEEVLDELRARSPRLRRGPRLAQTARLRRAMAEALDLAPDALQGTHHVGQLLIGVPRIERHDHHAPVACPRCDAVAAVPLGSDEHRCDYCGLAW